MIDNKKIEEFTKELNVLLDKYQFILVANAGIKDGLIVAGIQVLPKEENKEEVKE